jgi:hypothetical protein
MNIHRLNRLTALKDSIYTFNIRRIQRNTPLKQLLNRIMKITPVNNEYD